MRTNFIEDLSRKQLADDVRYVLQKYGEDGRDSKTMVLRHIRGMLSRLPDGRRWRLSTWFINYRMDEVMEEEGIKVTHEKDKRGVPLSTHYSL